MTLANIDFIAVAPPPLRRQAPPRGKRVTRNSCLDARPRMRPDRAVYTLLRAFGWDVGGSVRPERRCQIQDMVR